MENVIKSIALLVIMLFIAISTMAQKRKVTCHAYGTSYEYKGPRSRGKVFCASHGTSWRKKPETSSQALEIKRNESKISKSFQRSAKKALKNAKKNGPRRGKTKGRR